MMILKTLAVFTFICGVFAFGMSFHNIDLAFNAAGGAIDVNGFGYMQTIPQMYLNGITGILISATTMIFGFSLLFLVKERTL